MVKRILNHRSKTIFSAAAILAITSLASRILGLFRDRLLAGRFGAGDTLDIYFSAFRLPDLIYNILIIGAISSAFIPVFAHYFRKDEKEAWGLAGGIFNSVCLILIVLAALLIFLAPWLVSIIAPGFSGPKKEMTIILTRIMFLSPLLLGLSSILSSILQYFHRFFISSLAPIMYNLGIIFGILFFVPKIGIVGLAWGVVLGAFLHFLIQLPSAFYSGFRFKFKNVLTFYHEGIKKILKLMIPRTIGLAGAQIDLLVVTAIASTLGSGSVSIFNLANNLQYVPIGIIGISFSMAVFPRLARSHAEENREEFSKNFSSTFSRILYLVLPFTVLFILLRAQIVRIILGTGQFGWFNTRLTAAALGVFSLAIFAQSLIPLITRAFYSFHNTKTPVIISLCSVALDIFGCFAFTWILKNKNIFSDFVVNVLKLSGVTGAAVIGLSIAFVISGITNFLLLLIYFNKKIGCWHPKLILNSLAKILISCLVMGLAIYGLLYCLNFVVNNRTFIGIFLQTAGAGLGGIIIYFGASFLLGSPETAIITKKIFRK